MRGNKGFTILETLIALGLSMMMGLGMMGMMNRMNWSVSTLGIQARRDSLRTNLADALPAPENLFASLSNNPNLRACLSQDGSNDCENGKEYPLVVQTPNGEKLSGDASSPAYYSVEGVPCASADKACPLQARSVFQATCFGGSAQCDRAVSIRVIAALEPVSGMKMASTTPLRSSGIRRDVSAESILARGARTCSDPAKRVFAIGPTGELDCRPPQTTEVTCGPGQFLKGIKYENGNMIPSCQPIPVASFGRCPANYVAIGNNPDGSPQCAPAEVSTFGGAFFAGRVNGEWYCVNGNPRVPPNGMGDSCYCPDGFGQVEISSFVSDACAFYNLRGIPNATGCAVRSVVCTRS